jgi:phospholipid/cholesterol/gamma-HCH transport system substrate-binding protein
MNKAAPSPARIMTMVVFALSCFGLLLFLWLSFGGPIPLKPKGYRVQVAFDEASALGLEADVRVAGVSVGKVRSKDLVDNGNRTLVEIEMERKFAPVAKDARVILRQKTLLGETYVEITPGSSDEKLPEGGRLADGQVEEAVQLDEVFQALDPKTREAFRTWQASLAEGIEGRGRDFNDIMATLPEFAADATDVLAVLDSQEGAVQRLVKNTGTVFGALSENEQQLRNLITASNEVFAATASQDEALADTFRVFPTFLDESKSTLARLKTFSADTRPLISDLRPVARDLEPTLTDVRRLAPDLENTFEDLDPLIEASREGLPALKETLDGVKPMLAELGPFLSETNPIFEFFEDYQHPFADFLTAGGWALADTTTSENGTGHYLRQFGPMGAESIGLFRERLSSNRGNSYPNPNFYDLKKGAEQKIWPSWDCRNAGGEKPVTDGPPGAASPACHVQKPIEFQGLSLQFPHVQRADYTK